MSIEKVLIEVSVTASEYEVISSRMIPNRISTMNRNSICFRYRSDCVVHASEMEIIRRVDERIRQIITTHPKLNPPVTRYSFVVGMNKYNSSPGCYIPVIENGHLWVEVYLSGRFSVIT